MPISLSPSHITVETILTFPGKYIWGHGRWVWHSVLNQATEIAYEFDITCNPGLFPRRSNTEHFGVLLTTSISCLHPRQGRLKVELIAKHFEGFFIPKFTTTYHFITNSGQFVSFFKSIKFSCAFQPGLGQNPQVWSLVYVEVVAHHSNPSDLPAAVHS